MGHRARPGLSVGLFAACLALGAALTGLAANGAERALFVDRPTFIVRDTPDYAEKGRIAGALNMCPGCRVDIMHPKVGVVQSFTLRLADAEFRSAPLEPDTYTLRVAADGWPTLAAPKIDVKAGYDTSVRVRFVERKASEGSAADAKSTAKKRPPIPPRRIATDLDEGGLSEVDEAIKDDKPKGKKKDKGNRQGQDRGKKKGKKKGKKGKRGKKK